MADNIKSEVLFCILKSQHQVEEVLKGFIELGVPGASVLDAKGMVQILNEQIPVFSGFKSMFTGEGYDTQIIISVIQDSLIEKVFERIEEICSNFESPGSGLLFTLPVSRVSGLKRNLKKKY